MAVERNQHRWCDGTELHHRGAHDERLGCVSGGGDEHGRWRVERSRHAHGVDVSGHITQQPAFAGSNATFTAAADGLLLFFQWRRGGLALTGATNFSVTLTNVARTNAGDYTLVVTNLAGAATSAPAALTVHVRQRFDAPASLGGGVFRLRFGFEDGFALTAGDLARFDAQSSSNLVDWVALTNVLSVSGGQLQLDDTSSPQFLRRFYRVIER